ncbi:GMC oxidoreductase [Celeribacter persicus]|uniref:Choline dehydrogenase-like flavoprotein n=1 Tax=Celeribacter persicus TaxID=1651082 RepID=A0A2T5H559_9RHOB|nr:GMC oxidoreductase [Celeribacter persicus]PTQ66715.1 choline dehydrogenase-like flavoprotein [Celeribacter persicus]
MRSEPEYDIAIVGSGPVGVALARRLVGSGRRIALIEAGDARHRPEDEAGVQAAARLTPQSHPAGHLYRRRMLGGASSVWGGRCLPFATEDFAQHPARSGWPIGYEDVSPYWAEALDFLEAGEPVFDEAAFAVPRPWAGGRDVIDFDQIERFSKPTDVWKRYGAELAASDGIDVLSNSLVREVLLDRESGRVRALDLRDTRTGAARQLTARRVILAGGGIETARLLLASRSLLPGGIGNQNDLVGRSYMTHLIGDVGTLTYSGAVPFERLDYRLTRDGIYGRTIMRLPASLRAAEGLPNVLWRPNIAPIWDPAHGSSVLSAMHFAKHLVAPREYADRLAAQGRLGEPQSFSKGFGGHVMNLVRHPFALVAFAADWTRRRTLAERKLPSVFLRSRNASYALELNAEQYPDAGSRIGLSDQVDRLGMPLVTIDWQAGEATLTGLKRSLVLLQDGLARAGIGRFQYDPELVEGQIAPQGGHHMGTVRMARTPSEGVVDTTSTVFGHPNLHVAGAAVFATSSSVNPTLLAVALAMRLGNYIKSQERWT